jgi:hypothetical protein
MQFHQLLSRAQLADRFGPVVSADGPVTTTERDLVGPLYRALLTETSAIVAHQWQAGIRHGAIKGFFLSGPPGIGKTSLALRVGYELALRLAGDEAGRDGAPGEPLVLALIDGGDIAR